MPQLKSCTIRLSFLESAWLQFFAEFRHTASVETYNTLTVDCDRTSWWRKAWRGWMTRLEVNVSTGSLVSSLQPAPAEGDSYSCQQPVTDRTPAETEHSSSEVVLHRTVLQTLWRALCSRNSCSLIVCEADAKPVRAATLSSQIYISNQYWGWCQRFSSGTYARVYSSSSYSTIPLLGYSSLILEMSFCPFPQTPTDQSVRFNNNSSGLCGANHFAEQQLMHYHTPFTHTHTHTHTHM